MFKKDLFGQFLLLRKLIIRTLGSITYLRFNFWFKPVISGTEILDELPDTNVVFISNHQTYFGDVSFFYHAFYSALAGKPNNIRFPGYLFCRKQNIFYVAAEETMKAGFLPKILALTGAVTIKRSWRANGQNVRRKVDKSESEKIDKAIENGWVITFPQGTTAPYAPGRVGTAILLKKHKPVVVPIVIDGFRRGFDKKGLFIKKRGTSLKMRMKSPMNIDYDNKKVEEILGDLMESIEQSKEHEHLHLSRRS